MKAKVIEHNDKNATVRFETKSAAAMNALRSAITQEVPVLAIHTVEFRKQTSALYDEVLAHRLGLVPLTTDYGSYEYENLADEAARSARSMAKLYTTASGPGIVHADALTSKDPSIKPAYPTMPLVTLTEGQEVEFEATAIMGKGRQHAKWQPGIAAYQEVADVKVKNTKPEKSVRDQLPKEILNGTEIDPKRITTPQLIDAIDGVDENTIMVERKDDAFDFTAESFGMITPAQMILQGFVELERMLDTFKKNVEETLS